MVLGGFSRHTGWIQMGLRYQDKVLQVDRTGPLVPAWGVDIHNPYKVGILQYAEKVRGMHYLYHFLPCRIKKGEDFHEEYFILKYK